VFQSKDEQALIIPRVKNRVREFLNMATYDTWFNFPESFGIAVNLGYGSIYGLHKSLGCSPIETSRGCQIHRLALLGVQTIDKMINGRKSSLRVTAINI
jgi:hypothetical protein